MEPGTIIDVRKTKPPKHPYYVHVWYKGWRVACLGNSGKSWFLLGWNEILDVSRHPYWRKQPPKPHPVNSPQRRDARKTKPPEWPADVYVWYLGNWRAASLSGCEKKWDLFGEKIELSKHPYWRLPPPDLPRVRDTQHDIEERLNT